MRGSAQAVKPVSGYAIDGFLALLTGLKTKAKAALLVLQKARMHSTLSRLTETQLAQIGITRSDIPAYAERLMADD